MKRSKGYNYYLTCQQTRFMDIIIVNFKCFRKLNCFMALWYKNRGERNVYVDIYVSAR